MPAPGADRLEPARRLLTVLAAVVLLAVALTVGLQAWQQVRPPSIVPARCLAVTELVLSPAGTPARHPQLRHPAVDPRQAPSLPPLPKGVP